MLVDAAGVPAAAGDAAGTEAIGVVGAAGEGALGAVLLATTGRCAAFALAPPEGGAVCWFAMLARKREILARANPAYRPAG